MVNMPYGQSGDLGAHHVRGLVEKRCDTESAVSEPSVVGQGAPQVADADDGHGPVLGETELAGDLVDEVFDVIADSAGAVGPEVGEVFAELGRVHPRRRGEFPGRHRGDSPLAQRLEGTEVERESGDCRLWDTPIPRP